MITVETQGLNPEGKETNDNKECSHDEEDKNKEFLFAPAD